MRPTTFSDPAKDCGLSPLNHRHDSSLLKTPVMNSPVLREAGSGGREAGTSSLLERSAVSRLALLSLSLAALWAGVFWALH